MPVPMTLRNATLAETVELLQRQHEAKVDAVVPATAIRSENAIIRVQGLGFEAQAGLDPLAEGAFLPTKKMDYDLSEKLGIPSRYVYRMREERPDLYDLNVNGWLHGTPLTPGSEAAYEAYRTGQEYPADGRTFLFRGFNDHETGVGIARCLLSERYYSLENLDVVVSALDAARETGVQLEVFNINVTEDRLDMRLGAPAVTALAPHILGNYRSPYTGQSGADVPVVQAGIRIDNSETGGGAYNVAPYIVFLVCKNGMTMTKDAYRKVHLGSKLEQGVIQWSADTRRKNLELIQATTRDAVTTFLTPAYVEGAIAEIAGKANVELADGAKTVEIVAKQLQFNEETTKGVLAHFMVSAINPSLPRTAGDVMQAVTSWAQSASADVAFDLETQALRVLELAAAAK